MSGGGVGFSLSSRVFHCLQARVITIVSGVLRAGTLRGVGSGAGGGLVGIGYWSQRSERGWQAFLEGVGVDECWSRAPIWEEDGATR